jgi:hypothetical protein
VKSQYVNSFATRPSFHAAARIRRRSVRSLSRFGRRKEGPARADLIDVYDHLNLSNGEKAYRNVAMIYADHNWRPERALELAQAEIAMRHDIYTQDALAWALHRNGKLSEAKTAMSEAAP